MPHTKLQQATSPDITTISTTLYNSTTRHTIPALNSDHLPIITTINTHTIYKLQQNRHKFTQTIGKQTGHSSLQTPRLLSIHHRHAHSKHHLHKHYSSRRQTQPHKRQDTPHMQTTPITHKTQYRTQKQHQSTKRK